MFFFVLVNGSIWGENIITVTWFFFSVDSFYNVLSAMLLFIVRKLFKLHGMHYNYSSCWNWIKFHLEEEVICVINWCLYLPMTQFCRIFWQINLDKHLECRTISWTRLKKTLSYWLGVRVNWNEMSVWLTSGSHLGTWPGVCIASI